MGQSPKKQKETRIVKAGKQLNYADFWSEWWDSQPTRFAGDKSPVAHHENCRLMALMHDF